MFRKENEMARPSKEYQNRMEGMVAALNIAKSGGGGSSGKRHSHARISKSTTKNDHKGIR